MSLVVPSVILSDIIWTHKLEYIPLMYSSLLLSFLVRLQEFGELSFSQLHHVRSESHWLEVCLLHVMETLSLLAHVCSFFGRLGPILVVVVVQELLAVAVHETKSNVLFSNHGNVFVLA